MIVLELWRVALSCATGFKSTVSTALVHDLTPARARRQYFRALSSSNFHCAPGLVATAILAKAPKLQSAEFVFQTFIDGTGGWAERARPAYVVVIGALTSVVDAYGTVHIDWSVIAASISPKPSNPRLGFDASAHRPATAAMSGSVGIIMGIGVPAALGWFLHLELLFSIQDLDGTVNSPTGQPVAQIFIDCVGANGAIGLMHHRRVLTTTNVFSITSNSRMMYAFARDGGIPGSPWFAYVNQKWKSPIRTGIPVASVRIYNHSHFVQGPFHLEKFSFVIGILTVMWIIFISIAFILPQVTLVDSQTLNYSIVAVGIILIYIGFWFLSARKWFAGPAWQIEAESRGVNVMEGETLEEKMENEKMGNADVVEAVR
ncbi:hypothetical protein CYLTODRAFT_477636 [Cylindrobasidium torrendii FP15055 ss-10]|uniref:Uncharacterized protein n=1 Tax=Cylindrobasidium torrendii FP15055 ss-10 TaxID=1314674 RepID=A0A0D7ATK5_9AGAR|nr:hypothetical protein CYLTODRAFT_477636 [Cylindrobasidium torrendii FP15055 ss-10]